MHSKARRERILNDQIHLSLADPRDSGNLSIYEYLRPVVAQQIVFTAGYHFKSQLFSKATCTITG